MFTLSKILSVTLSCTNDINKIKIDVLLNAMILVKYTKEFWFDQEVLYRILFKYEMEKILNVFVLVSIAVSLKKITKFF